MRDTWKLILLAIGLVCASTPTVRGEEVRPQDEYMKRLKVLQTVQPLGSSPLGESINLYTGELSFRQVDVPLDGRRPDIVLARETSTAPSREQRLLPAAFHDWVLSVPRIETLMPMASTRGSTGGAVVLNPGNYWKTRATANDTSGTDQRCNQFGAPRYTSPIHTDDWWNGYELITETGTREMLLKRVPENPDKPSMLDSNGQPLIFPALTAGQWQVACLSNTSNGQPGQGFLAISPEGQKYFFDYLVGERATGIVQEAGIGTTKYYQQRMWATMYASRVEDRYRNFIDYHYVDDRLTSINRW